MSTQNPPAGCKAFNLDEALANPTNVQTFNGRAVTVMQVEKSGITPTTTILKVRFAATANTYRYDGNGNMLAPSNVEPYQLFIKK